MPVELSPAASLDIDQEMLDFAEENYCANCIHFSFDDRIPFCEYWEESTDVESGMIGRV